MSLWICPRCETLYPGGVFYCPKCGTNLNWASVEITEQESREADQGSEEPER